MCQLLGQAWDVALGQPEALMSLTSFFSLFPSCPPLPASRPFPPPAPLPLISRPPASSRAEQCSGMVPEMRGLSPGRRLPEPAPCPAAGGSPEPWAAGRRRHVLALPEEEAWRPQQCALLEADASDEVGMLPASPRTAAAGFDNFFPVQEGEGPGWEAGAALEAGSSPFLPVSPEVMKRRRGGLIEQRDIIKAHEAHKMQSTPQARRKEWE